MPAGVAGWGWAGHGEYGPREAAPARVIKEYEHKGHRFVEVGVIVTANDETVVSHVHHTAIYRPRQVTGG